MKTRAEAGVKIKVLGKVEKKWESELTLAGAAVHEDEAARALHDPRSQDRVCRQPEPARTGARQRREVGLITKDVRTVRRMAAVFEDDWKKNRG